MFAEAQLSKYLPVKFKVLSSISGTKPKSNNCKVTETTHKKEQLSNLGQAFVLCSSTCMCLLSPSSNLSICASALQ